MRRGPRSANQPSPPPCFYSTRRRRISRNLPGACHNNLELMRLAQDSARRSDLLDLEMRPRKKKKMVHIIDHPKYDRGMMPGGSPPDERDGNHEDRKRGRNVRIQSGQSECVGPCPGCRIGVARQSSKTRRNKSGNAVNKPPRRPDRLLGLLDRHLRTGACEIVGNGFERSGPRGLSGGTACGASLDLRNDGPGTKKTFHHAGGICPAGEG